MIKNESDIKWYDIELDYIAKKLNFDDFIKDRQEVIDEFDDLIKDLNQRIKEKRDSIVDIFKKDLSESNEHLLKLSEMFSTKPDFDTYGDVTL